MSDQTAENNILSRLIVLYPADRARRWMHVPHPLLHFKSPHDAIRFGRIAEVERILDAMESGSFL